MSFPQPDKPSNSGRTYFADKAAEKGRHGFQLFPGNLATQVGNHIPRAVVGNVGRPTRTDAFGTVHQNHGNHRNVKLGLNIGSVISQVREQIVVVRVENRPRDGFQFGKNVSSRRRVLSPTATRTELTRRREQIDVVGTLFVVEKRGEWS